MRAGSLGIKLPALTSGQNGSELTVSCSYHFTPNEKDSSSPILFIGSLTDFVESLETQAENRRIPDPVGNRTPVVYLIAAI
jgi:hypothetical protein